MNDVKEAARTADAHPYPALRLMQLAAPPVRFGRQPVWKLPEDLAIEAPLIPSWQWHTAYDFPPAVEIVTLTENGPYLAALQNVMVAHGSLHHTGYPQHRPFPLNVLPGYYRVTVPQWAFSGTIVSPLGDSSRLEVQEAVWIAAPTLVLLLELEAEGCIIGLEILDSYTAHTATSFRTWAQALRANRLQFVDQSEIAHAPDGTSPPADCTCKPCARLRRFDADVASAFIGLLTGTDDGVHRPDWAHTVYAAHSADMWRKAWRYSGTGKHLVALPHLDEIRVVRDDLQRAMERREPPFVVDVSGRTVGSLRVLSTGRLEAAL